MADNSIPFQQRLTNHLMRELGPEYVKKHMQLSEALGQQTKQYEAEYGYDSSKWPKGVVDKMMKESKQIIDMLIPKHLQQLEEDLSDIESANQGYDDVEPSLRRIYPEHVGRMERGQVQRVEEPRAPAPQPQAPTPEPSKTKEPPRPAMAAPAQKPGEVKQPKMVVTAGPSALRQREHQPSAFEKAVASQRDKWEKEGLFTPPPMQDIAKQRLLQLHDKEEEEVPVSLPEAVNPTAR